MKDDFAAEWLDLVTALAPEQCLDVATRIASRLNALRGDDSGRFVPRVIPYGGLSCDAIRVAHDGSGSDADYSPHHFLN